MLLVLVVKVHIHILLQAVEGLGGYQIFIHFFQPFVKSLTSWRIPILLLVHLFLDGHFLLNF